MGEAERRYRRAGEDDEVEPGNDYPAELSPEERVIRRKVDTTLVILMGLGFWLVYKLMQYA